MSPRHKTHRFRPCSDVTLTSQRPLFDQPNLYWHRPPSITDLLRPTVDLLQPPTTYTATSLRPNKAIWRRPPSMIDLVRPTVNLLQPPTTSTATSLRPKKPILASSFDLDRPSTTYCKPTTTSSRPTTAFFWPNTISFGHNFLSTN